jgi:hypothetical protein
LEVIGEKEIKQRKDNDEFILASTVNNIELSLEDLLKISGRFVIKIDGGNLAISDN